MIELRVRSVEHLFFLENRSRCLKPVLTEVAQEYLKRNRWLSDMSRMPSFQEGIKERGITWLNWAMNDQQMDWFVVNNHQQKYVTWKFPNELFHNGCTQSLHHRVPLFCENAQAVVVVASTIITN